jgi:hypothetical protein
MSRGVPSDKALANPAGINNAYFNLSNQNLVRHSKSDANLIAKLQQISADAAMIGSTSGKKRNDKLLAKAKNQLTKNQSF